MKKCSTCKELKSLSDFHKKSSTIDGLEYDCKNCANFKIRERRKRNNNISTIKYEKTKKGKLVRTYRNMKSRVEGILKKKSHLYEGLPILNKEVFYDWALSNKEYNMLFEEWEKSNYNLKLSPSIDRIDPLKGYTLCNMRWVSFQENCSNIRR